MAKVLMKLLVKLLMKVLIKIVIGITIFYNERTFLPNFNQKIFRMIIEFNRIFLNLIL